MHPFQPPTITQSIKAIHFHRIRSLVCFWFHSRRLTSMRLRDYTDHINQNYGHCDSCKYSIVGANLMPLLYIHTYEKRGALECAHHRRQPWTELVLLWWKNFIFQIFHYTLPFPGICVQIFFFSHSVKLPKLEHELFSVQIKTNIFILPLCTFLFSYPHSANTKSVHENHQQWVNFIQMINSPLSRMRKFFSPFPPKCNYFSAELFDYFSSFSFSLCCWRSRFTLAQLSTKKKAFKHTSNDLRTEGMESFILVKASQSASVTKLNKIDFKVEEGDCRES